MSFALAALLACESALAHGKGRSGSSRGAHSSSPTHHRHARTFLGTQVFVAPLWPAWFYGPYLASPPQPVVYVEKADGPPVAGEWFYCPASGAYFPDAPECPEGWQRIRPAPGRPAY